MTTFCCVSMYSHRSFFCRIKAVLPQGSARAIEAFSRRPSFCPKEVHAADRRSSQRAAWIRRAKPAADELVPSPYGTLRRIQHSPCGRKTVSFGRLDGWSG